MIACYDESHLVCDTLLINAVKTILQWTSWDMTPETLVDALLNIPDFKLSDLPEDLTPLSSDTVMSDIKEKILTHLTLLETCDSSKKIHKIHELRKKCEKITNLVEKAEIAPSFKPVVPTFFRKTRLPTYKNPITMTSFL